MALLLLFSTLFLHAAPRCVEIFDVNESFASKKVPQNTTSTQDGFIKNYLALNMAFPQHRSTISLGVTAFYFSRGMAFELIYKNLSEKQWESVYNSMIRAHAANGVKVPVTLADAQFVLASFTMTMPYRIARTQTWLETHFGSKESFEVIARIQRYSDTILAALRSPEAREFSLRFRQDLQLRESHSTSPRYTREQISDETRDLVIQKLQEVHSELSEPMSRELYESMI